MYIGKDTDGDGIPDVPLRFEMDSSRSVIQFPLGFCPGAIKEDFVYSQSRERLDKSTKECQGQWGLVLKEWETITAVRVPSILYFGISTRFVDREIMNARYIFHTYFRHTRNQRKILISSPNNLMLQCMVTTVEKYQSRIW